MRNMVNYQKIQCDNCGSVDFIEYADETLVCKHCRTGYRRIEAEQSLYERKEWCRDAEHWRKLENYGMAEEIYRRLTRKYPRNYAGWYGLTKLIDWDTWYYRQDPDDSNPPLPDYCTIALKTAHDPQLYAEMNSYFAEMRGKHQKPAQEARRNYENTIKAYDGAIEKGKETVNAYNDKIGELNSSNRMPSQTGHGKFFAGFGVIIALAVIIFSIISFKSCAERWDADRMNFDDGAAFNEYLIRCGLLIAAILAAWIVLKGIARIFSNSGYRRSVKKYENTNKKIGEYRSVQFDQEKVNSANMENKRKILDEHNKLMNKEIIIKTNKLNIHQ